MSNPWFKFFTSDWLGNAKLKRCTHEEKGIWIDVLCLLHDQAEYGVVRWPLDELAQAAGTSKIKLKKLVEKGILKGADKGQVCLSMVYTPRSARKEGDPVTLIAEQDGPIWYSSRMVEDEYKKNVRGNQNTPSKPSPNHSPKPPFGETSKPSPNHSPSPCADDQIPEARSQIKEKESLSPPPLREVAPAGPAQDAASDPLASPYGQLAGLLRREGVDVHPGLVSFRNWVDAGLTQDEALAALSIARQAKPRPDPIPWNYLAKVLETQRRAPRPPAGAAAPRAGTAAATADWQTQMAAVVASADQSQPRIIDMGAADVIDSHR